jgi:hypothetical protein
VTDLHGLSKLRAQKINKRAMKRERERKKTSLNEERRVATKLAAVGLAAVIRYQFGVRMLKTRHVPISTGALDDDIFIYTARGSTQRAPKVHATGKAQI